jgi:hypothetical protein
VTKQGGSDGDAGVGCPNTRMEAPWSMLRWRLRESRWEAVRLYRSPTVDMPTGVGKVGEAVMGEPRVLSLATGEDKVGIRGGS